MCSLVSVILVRGQGAGNKEVFFRPCTGYCLCMSCPTGGGREVEERLGSVHPAQILPCPPARSGLWGNWDPNQVTLRTHPRPPPPTGKLWLSIIKIGDSGQYCSEALSLLHFFLSICQWKILDTPLEKLKEARFI